MQARRAFILILALLAGSAIANECMRPVTVTSTALGSPAAVENQAMADAVTAALNQAITQVRGVFVTSRQDLWTSFETSVIEGVSSVTLEDEFTQTMTSRFSGFVERYELLDRVAYSDGSVEVTLDVTVCTDERIAVGIDATGPAKAAIIGALAQDIRSAGWQIISESPPRGASEGRLLEFTMANGVSYLAQGSVVTSYGESNGFDTATVTLTINLIDTTTMQVGHSFNASTSGIGASQDIALQDASQKIGRDLGRSWNSTFLAPDERLATSFVFEGVNRNGTSYSLRDIVEKIGGVLSVESFSFDQSRREVHMSVHTASDPCAIAQDVPKYRRVVTELIACAPGTATFRVYND